MKSTKSHCIALLLATLNCSMFFYSAAAAADQLYVVTTDYETGGNALLDCASMNATTNEGGLFQDSVARYFSDRIYVVERFQGDSILIFNHDDLENPVRQFSVGNGTNPHDFLLLSQTKAYVTLYNSTKLLIVNPESGSITGNIDLTSFADSDGIPEMDMMVLHDNKVFVTLQRLDRNNFYAPSGLSQVVVIDPDTDTVVDTDASKDGVQAINLTFTNPLSMQYVPDADKILVAEEGNYSGVSDGGFEYINPGNYAAEGIVLNKEKLDGQMGGAFGAFTMIDSSQGYAIILTSDWTNTSVIRFNLATGDVSTVDAPKTGFVHADIVTMGDRLYVADRTSSNPGIRIFAVADDSEVTGTAINTGLPPFCLAPMPSAATTSTTTTINFAGTSTTTTTLPSITTTTSIQNTSTTTTTIPVCPATKVLGRDNPQLNNLRNFRDSILAHNAIGRRLIEIYYTNADSINDALERNPALRDFTRAVLESIAPVTGKTQR